MGDAAALDRFVEAQEATYDQALAEIRQGAKRSHWMWFIFPQLAGLGHSAMAQRYAIASLAEGRAYLEHPVLGAHYRSCVAHCRLWRARMPKRCSARSMRSSCAHR
jgi:uncharacterized protein (DUF1810 family)